MTRHWRPTLLYAFAHFAVDLGCAYGAFRSYGGDGVGFLLYNFCAFALQMPMGLLADAWGRNRRFALAGAVLVAALCLLPRMGWVGMVLLGIGNGLFHVGGGVDVLNLSGSKAAPLGVFVAPGAFGIFLGTLLGKSFFSPLPVLLALALACGGMVLGCRPEELPKNAPLILPGTAVVPWAGLLFLVVALRSYGGMAAAFDWKTGHLAWAAVCAVVLGKALGGILSDRVGLFRAAAWSLSLCGLCFCFSSHAIPGLLALLLFNMSMPMTLSALARAMPGAKGFSFGLLTFALFLGYLPSWLGAGSIGGFAMAAVALISGGLLLPALRRLEQRRDGIG